MLEKTRLVHVLLIVGFVAMGVADEQQEELLKMLRTTCIDETGATDAQVINANKGEFEDDEKFKCYIKCIFEQMACISDDGIIDEDALISVMPEAVRDQAALGIHNCGTKIGANACENSWLTHKCYYEFDSKYYFLP